MRCINFSLCAFVLLSSLAFLSQMMLEKHTESLQAFEADFQSVCKKRASTLLRISPVSMSYSFKMFPGCAS
jgi:hypothetical protein